jgi:hypothetical protein
MLGGVGGLLCTSLSMPLWFVSTHKKLVSQHQTLMYLRQREVSRDSGNQDCDSLGILDPSTPLSPGYFERTLRRLQMEHHITGLKYSMHPTNSDHPGMSTFILSMNMQAVRNKNIVDMLRQLATLIPGIIVFEKIQITRDLPILSHAEFTELLKTRNKKKKIPPSFSARVQFKVVILSEFSKNFAEIESR